MLDLKVETWSTEQELGLRAGAQWRFSVCFVDEQDLDIAEASERAGGG